MLITEKPWGKMWLLIHTTHFWLKIIKVNNNGRTSLQAHEHREEYHIKMNRPFGFKKITIMQKHRMTEGLYIEIATGKPEETDIIHYEDDYGRIGQ